MCFSATASFIASASLSTLGVASLRKASSPEQYSFAAIPLVFAAQQFCESLVWLSLTRERWAHITPSSSIVFLFIAQVVWPLWMPYSFLHMERDARRKKMLRLFLLPGFIVAAYFLYCLISFQVVTTATNHHVFYKLDFPKDLIPIAAGFYLAATVAPALGSKSVKIKLIGIILLASYIIARIFFQPSLISVWCFLAIAVSILIYLVMCNPKPQHSS